MIWGIGTSGWNHAPTQNQKIWGRDQLDLVLRTRYDMERSVVLAGTVAVPRLKRILGDRLMSLIPRLCGDVVDVGRFASAVGASG